MPQAIDDTRGKDAPRRNDRSEQTHQQPRSAPEQNRFRFQIEYRKPSFGKRSLKTVNRGQGHAQTEGAAQDRENQGLAGEEEKQLRTGKAQGLEHRAGGAVQVHAAEQHIARSGQARRQRRRDMIVVLATTRRIMPMIKNDMMSMAVITALAAERKLC